MSIITIDPGAGGGIAWTHEEPEQVEAVAMPEGMTAQADLLRSLSAQGFRRAIIEKVGTYQPGNSGPSAATFAMHVGAIDALCYAFGISVEKVTPQKWMKDLGHGVTRYLPEGYKDMPKGKEKTAARAKAVRENKAAIKEAMARRYPYLNVTLKTADALGIMAWAENKGVGI